MYKLTQPAIYTVIDGPFEKTDFVKLEEVASIAKMEAKEFYDNFIAFALQVDRGKAIMPWSEDLESFKPISESPKNFVTIFVPWKWAKHALGMSKMMRDARYDSATKNVNFTWL